MAWVPQQDWESSPEYRWVPSRVDEHESRAASLIEQTGLPDLDPKRVQPGGRGTVNVPGIRRNESELQIGHLHALGGKIIDARADFEDLDFLDTKSAVIYPTVMIPAFGVPSSILLHFLSLRQLYRPVKPRAQVARGLIDEFPGQRSRPRWPAPLVEPGAVFAHLLALRCRRVALAG